MYYSTSLMTTPALPLKVFFQLVIWYLAFYGTFLFSLCSAVHAIIVCLGMQHTAFENAWPGP